MLAPTRHANRVRSGLSVSPLSIQFNYTQGDPLPQRLPVSITTTLAWKWSDSIKGFNISAETGSGNATLYLTPNSDMTNLPVGTNGGVATITAGTLKAQIAVSIVVKSAPVIIVTPPPPPPPPGFTNELPICRPLHCPYQPWDEPLGFMAVASDGIKSVAITVDGKTPVVVPLGFSAARNAPWYPVPFTPDMFANGERLIQAIVTTNAGRSKTYDLPVTINAASSNFVDYFNMVFSGGLPGSTAGRFRRFRKCTFNGGDRIFYVNPTGWLRQDYVFDSVCNNVANGFRNCGGLFNGIAYGCTDDFATDTALIVNAQDIGHLAPSGSHGDAVQFSPEEIDASVTNVILYGVISTGGVVQGISSDAIQDWLIDNCQIESGGHWAFYSGGHAPAAGGGVNNLFMRNTHWGSGPMSLEAGGGLSVPRNLVIENCTGAGISSLVAYGSQVIVR